LNSKSKNTESISDKEAGVRYWEDATVIATTASEKKAEKERSLMLAEAKKLKAKRKSKRPEFVISNTKPQIWAYKPDSKILTITPAQIRRILKRYNIKRSVLAKSIGVSEKSVQYWLYDGCTCHVSGPALRLLKFLLHEVEPVISKILPSGVFLSWMKTRRKSVTVIHDITEKREEIEITGFDILRILEYYQISTQILGDAIGVSIKTLESWLHSKRSLTEPILTSVPTKLLLGFICDHEIAVVEKLLPDVVIAISIVSDAQHAIGDDIKYKPLKNVLDFIDDDSDMTTDEIKAELKECGIDADDWDTAR
jgi:DNA-binding transcriptional regulator YiaG